jgi:hypothetical protein
MWYFVASVVGGFLGVLLSQIHKEAFVYDFWADATDEEIAARHIDRRYKLKTDRAQELMSRASALSREARRGLKIIEDDHLHHSLNEMMRFSWPKQTELVMKPSQVRQLIAA